jgi:MOSC domain-containing protein YiiM
MMDPRVRTGRVDAIWLKRARLGPMDRVEAATLVAGRGLAGNANQGGRRQVAIVSREAWDELMAELGGGLDPSARRANLLVSGLPLARSRGSELRVGAARIRLLGELTPCERMDEALPGLHARMREGWRGGAFGEVLEGGVVRVGDAIELVRPREPTGASE